VRAGSDTLLVQTLDFFTPVVDDPYDYGQIAAAHSLSDVYAMGGRPLTAMNIVCFPTRKLGTEVLREILRGGLDKVRESGAMLAGGHTVEDAEPKFGLSVTGLVQEDELATKGGLQAGEVLILTKPLGVGILTTAQKRGLLPEDLLKQAVQSMARLNAAARDAMVAAGARGGTDITGYALLGHAMEMARASQVQLELDAASFPLLPGVQEMREQGCWPGGSAANRVWLEGSGLLEWGSDVSELLRDVLCDAQTSGGLFFGVAESRVDPVLQALPEARVVGRVRVGPQPRIVVR
jgi:selenide,water dikinase